MRVAGDDGVGVAPSEIQQRAHHTAQQRAHAARFLAQPQARIERHLLIAAAAGVNLVGYRAGMLLQLADDVGVDVFIGGIGVDRLLANFVEGGDNLCALFPGQDADALQRARERLRATDIGVHEPPVEIERPRETLEDLGRSRFKTPAPEFHLGLPAMAARTLMGRPTRLMKPRASF